MSRFYRDAFRCLIFTLGLAFFLPRSADGALTPSNVCDRILRHFVEPSNPVSVFTTTQELQLSSRFTIRKTRSATDSLLQASTFAIKTHFALSVSPHTSEFIASVAAKMIMEGQTERILIIDVNADAEASSKKLELLNLSDRIHHLSGRPIEQDLALMMDAVEHEIVYFQPTLIFYRNQAEPNEAPQPLETVLREDEVIIRTAIHYTVPLIWNLDGDEQMPHRLGAAFQD